MLFLLSASLTCGMSSDDFSFFTPHQYFQFRLITCKEDEAGVRGIKFPLTLSSKGNFYDIDGRKVIVDQIIRSNDRPDITIITEITILNPPSTDYRFVAEILSHISKECAKRKQLAIIHLRKKSD